ncbi:hypothetical protein LTR10_021635 [Elasticomyces elasticus]|uniref:Zn(2)-C6 fungal-type domain-containing protein n=1 Tax=Exophiala sideris TaxID=1016849 RepID=A0ABR0J277_9EURO|nr:hypothetical protein LTR10_021635 [Elasticomyces elasticus]KAK5024121.1 hypothetical protein LTS07_008856 [Exophiala sideris]KAK5029019.1 hypothetical protein LTR13_008889 [Exophiala sideris]KAK5054833.1 hypothetical protein LTR69_008741 [Exophiala sideris]KAK5178842.1 hypothetical protein LTR44_008670 [Eurotiomycetes sp. CCFEE 6388]
MGSGNQPAKLRTKTGCQICRNRKKKCDETRPSCQRCVALGLSCQWPTAEDLFDRRCTPARRQKSVSQSPVLSKARLNRDHDRDGVVATSPAIELESRLSLLSESAAHRALSRDLESVIARHFVDKYYCLLLLPNCHPDYSRGWITDIQRLMVECKSLQYSVLACAASHLHYIDDSSQMQELALTYYSHALRGLSELLAKPGQLESHNGLLMSVMLLYLHGCMGRGTYTDIPRHVNAAIRILSLRLMSHDESISKPFDRLAVESVLYQIFLVTMGSWSDPIELDYHFNAQFWLQAERLLTLSTLFPDRSMSFNSPVLGLPLGLFKLALSIKQLYQSPFRSDPETLEQFRSELENWEGAVLSDQDLDPLSADEERNDAHRYYRDAAYLYILTASMLIEQLSDLEEKTGPPEAAPSDCWQVRKVCQLLRAHRDDDEWARCFIGNWPVYTLGFFMQKPEDMRLVWEDLLKRWNLTKFGQVARFRKDVENTWARRGFTM